MGAHVFGNEFFDQWLNQKSNEILSKVEREKISTEDMLILSLKAQVNHFHHMDIEFREEFKKINEKMDMRFEQIDKRFEQVDKRFEQFNKRFEQVDVRIEQVLDQVDKRLQQTIGQSDKNFKSIDGRFDLADKRADKMIAAMMWGFGLFFTSQLGIIVKLFL